MTTYFGGQGFVQLLFLMLYLSGLWGSLLRSMYIKRNKLLKFQFLLGSLKKLLGNSVLYYQARKKGFWTDSEAWKLMSNALPLSNWVKMAKFDDFLKIAEFFTVFGKLAPQNFLFLTQGVCWNVFLIFLLASLYLTKYCLSKLKISVFEL